MTIFHSPHSLHKVYLINLHVVIHYIVRYYIVIPLYFKLKSKIVNRKIKAICTALCLFLIFSYCVNLPDYSVVNSMSFSSANTRETEIKVVVYKYWNLNEIIKSIEQEHNKINGVPTSLEINLYYSRWHIRHGIGPFKTVVFHYKQK